MTRREAAGFHRQTHARTHTYPRPQPVGVYKPFAFPKSQVMTTSPRYVSVDDTDKSIQYDGPWRQVNDAQNSLDVGPPFYRPAYYKNTLHSINDTVGNFASFSFNFSGMSHILFSLPILFSKPSLTHSSLIVKFY